LSINFSKKQNIAPRKDAGQQTLFALLSHPDYTVGSGITPDQPFYGSRAIVTAGFTPL
jgi:hypothetical protein